MHPWQLRQARLEEVVIVLNVAIVVFTLLLDILHDDLLQQLATWVKQGDRIVLTLDANEHVLNGKLCRELTNPARGLGLKEITHEHWGDTEPHTWINGREPIDGVWVSSKLEVTGVKILPFSERTIAP